MNKEFNTVQVDEYNGVQLQLYDGRWGVLAMQLGGGESRTWYKRWVFLSKWNNGRPKPDTKKVPMAVRLGDKEEAIKTLETLLKQVKGEVA